MKPIEKILALIEDRGLSMAKLEVMAGIPRNRVQKWGKGQGDDDLSLRYAERIARVLDVPLDWLADERTSMPPPDKSNDDEKALLALLKVKRMDARELLERLMNEPDPPAKPVKPQFVGSAVIDLNPKVRTYPDPGAEKPPEQIHGRSEIRPPKPKGRKDKSG